MTTRHVPQHARPRPARNTRARVAALAAVCLALSGAFGLAVTAFGPPGAAAPLFRATGAPDGPPADRVQVAAPSTADPVPAPAPVRLTIPAIGVDSELMPLGLRADGSLEVPPSGFPAGYYTGAPVPGELGPAVLAGHVDWDRRPGVFVDLRVLAPGDTVRVARADGSTAVFRVTDVQQHAKDAFPTDQVYGDIDHAGLRLITCGGSFDSTARSYVDNIVVFAELDRTVPV